LQLNHEKSSGYLEERLHAFMDSFRAPLAAGIRATTEAALSCLSGEQGNVNSKYLISKIVFMA